MKTHTIHTQPHHWAKCSPLPMGKKGHGNNEIRGWVHPTAGLDIEEKSKISCPARN